ncbi:MAG: mandelate racemase/muconate lactonizing enzyme family protein, partial [Geminicoccaceae bacterium]
MVLPLLEKPTGDGFRVLCEVETEDGLVGQGMTGKFLGHGVATVVEHYLAPAVVGMDPRDLEAIHARLMPLVSERGHMSGINLSALA